MGWDMVNKTIPNEIGEQCAILLRHVRNFVAAAGGTTDDITKMNVWLKDVSDRSALNVECTAMFPDSEIV
tara:strand:+ start:331 stop:540 length:210 start_codon:yes stop_codon:yes gene_type:complete